MKNNMDRLEECFLMSSRGEIYENVIKIVEKELIEKALERTGGNQIMAANMLGLNRNTLRTKIKNLDIKIQRFKQ